MKIPFLLMMLFLAGLPGCTSSGPPSTHTASDQFQSLTQKQAFVERYVLFRRTYQKLEFVIRYSNGNEGLVPAPSDWDIRLFAQVPADQIDDWITNRNPAPNADTSWIAAIPNAPVDRPNFQWFSDGKSLSNHRVIVGIDRQRRLIFYRHLAY